MLVRGEDLDRFARVLCRLLGNGIRELFLNAAASSGVADFGFFGRGFWIVNQHIATITDLDEKIAAQCIALSEQREQIQSRTGFHWWPKRIAPN